MTHPSWQPDIEKHFLLATFNPLNSVRYNPLQLLAICYWHVANNDTTFQTCKYSSRRKRFVCQYIHKQKDQENE